MILLGRRFEKHLLLKRSTTVHRDATLASPGAGKKYGASGPSPDPPRQSARGFLCAFASEKQVP